MATDKGKYFVHIDGTVIPIETAVEESESGAAGTDEIVDGKQMVHAPMPGKVVKIAVEEGQQVKLKDILCVVEAMKMENEVNATSEGMVIDIRHKEGSSVNQGDVLIMLKPVEG